MREFLKSFPGKLRHNVGLKLFSLILAYVVWLLVVAYYNPETTNLIKDIPVTINYGDSILEEQGLILVTTPDETVDVQIEGRRENLALISKDKVNARIDISSVTKAGEYELPVVIGVDGQTVTTVSQSIDFVTLKFEKAIKSQFAVDAVVDGKVAEGYVIEKVANPTMVTVTGPESIVSKIASIQAMVAQDQFTESAVYEANVLYLDKNGKDLSSEFLTLDVENVKVNINVYFEKVVPLQIDLINSAGGNDGSYLAAKIEPSTITIAGSEDALAQINSISLGTLDVSELSEEYREQFALILPNGVKNIDALERAEVSLSFDGIISKKFDLDLADVKIENVTQGTKVRQPEGKVSVVVRGNSADIEKLKKSDITLNIDCKNQTLSKGGNRLNLYFGFPEGLKVGAVGKYEITVQAS